MHVSQRISFLSLDSDEEATRTDEQEVVRELNERYGRDADLLEGGVAVPADPPEDMAIVPADPEPGEYYEEMDIVPSDADGNYDADTGVYEHSNLL